MFLMHGISHILNYLGFKIKDFFNNLFGDYSEGTLLIMAIVFFFGSLIFQQYTLVTQVMD